MSYHTCTYSLVTAGGYMLSDKQIKALKPLGKDQLLSDGGGLYVRMSKHGTRTFIYRSREGGTARYLTLGEYPHMTLAEARGKVSELQGKRLTGVTVSDAIGAFLVALEREYEHPEQVKRRLETDIIPHLGDKRLVSVTTADVSEVLQKICDRGSPVSANRTLADIKHVFQYAYGKGWVSSDPTIRITRKVVGGREKSREVVLSDDQLKDLIQVMRTDRFEVRTRVAVLVILLTGCRASEVLGIQKEEVEGRWWTIPKERTKNKKPHKVYLTYPARILLRGVEYVLGGDHRTLSKALRRYSGEFTPHDLRRTFSTKLNENGTPPHVVEKCLNHQFTGVMSVYNRAEYLPERREAWTKWARILLALR